MSFMVLKRSTTNGTINRPGAFAIWSTSSRAVWQDTAQQ